MLLFFFKRATETAPVYIEVGRGVPWQYGFTSLIQISNSQVESNYSNAEDISRNSYNQGESLLNRTGKILNDALAILIAGSPVNAFCYQTVGSFFNEFYV